MKNTIETSKIYNGSEISDDLISVVKRIAHNRYDSIIYKSSYENIENAKMLSEHYSIDLNDLYLVLGTDWFLFFEKNDNYIFFIEWVAEKSNRKEIRQAIEILNAFKDLLYENKNKMFLANMRHDSSYMFYKSLLEKEFLSEIIHFINIDSCYGNTPKEVVDLIDKYNNMDMFLKSDESKNHPEYLKFIIHLLSFEVTDKFIQKQEKIMKKYM